MRWDFWKYWLGETVSSFGSSMTQFVLPLLVFKLTGSALSLGVAFAMYGIPQLLFGLLIGAWTDRVDRKRLFIVVDLLGAAVAVSVPLAAAFGFLSVGWVYVMLFAGGTLGIFFGAAQFAAVPSLVEKDELVTANGRIQASFSAAMILGPLAAGALFAFLPIEAVMYIDAATFLFSALMLSQVKRPFNAPLKPTRTSLRADVVEGLRFVWRHPLLRSISVMMALINFVSVTVYAQLVLFAKHRFAVSDSDLGLLFAADGAGVVLLSLAAGPLRGRFTFGTVALGALMLSGMLTFALAYAPSYLAVVMLSAISAGLGTLFNINTGSLRQAIAPNQMLGRIITIAMVLAWSANPLGATIGGYIVERTGDVQSVYAAIGVLVFGIALYFRLFSPLGHAERYLETPAEGAAS